MAISVKAGTPDLSGNYIPEIWSSKLNVKYKNKLILSDITNTKYSGDIQNKGDKVWIRQLPTVTSSPYVKNEDLTFDLYEPDVISFTVDYARAIAFQADLLDLAMSDIDLATEWTQNNANQLAQDTELDILAAMYAGAGHSGITAGVESNIDLGAAGDPVSITTTNALNYVAYADQLMDEKAVPDEGRWMAIPAWFKTKLLLSDLKNASTMGDPKSVLRNNGKLGRIGKIDIYESNNLHRVADDNATCAMFGQKDAVGFASVLRKAEVAPREKGFGKVFKALHVYGYKVLKSDGLGHLYCTPGA